MVVLVNLPVVHIFLSLLTAVPDARVRHLHAHLLVEETLQRVRGMDPAIRVQHILGDVLRVNAVYGVSDVLARRHDETERDQQDHRYRVVQAKNRRVDVYIVHFNEILQSTKNV